MNQAQLKLELSNLIETWENEVIEFKEANDNYPTDKIGKYFSALTNEANLRGMTHAWLVFGVSDSKRSVVGTNYRTEPENLHSLKQQISSGTEPSVTFREIHELNHEEGRVVMMDIPAAPTGLPIAWKGHYYARAGESLTNLGIDKQDKIRSQTLATDWSAQIVAGATLDDLDELACFHARGAFATKYANRFPSEDISTWSLRTLLDRAKVTQFGQITRTALLLLGKPEAAYLLSPHPAQMTWKLEGPEPAYEHFGPPFLTNTSQLYQRIRNIQIRILPLDTLWPIEVSKYDQKIVLEALHNCIAHQDYNRNARIIVTEQEDRLVFANEGTFFEGKPDDYVEGTRTPLRYRNLFLAQAMAELNLIDTMGYGIHDMHSRQAHRFLPLPDYDLSKTGALRATIHGRIIDPAYSRLLMQESELPLADIVALDRVQKKLPIPGEVASRLKRAKLIRGRSPNLYVSSVAAVATGDKADYFRNKAQDDARYKKLLTDYLRKSGKCSRTEINKLLFPKLSRSLTDKEKTIKINNLLTKWRRAGLIVNRGSDRVSRWSLAEKKE